MFESTIALFDHYCKVAGVTKPEEFASELASEVRRRLKQLSWLIRRVKELEAEALTAIKRTGDVLRVHVEELKLKGISYESRPAPDEARMTKEEMEAHQKAAFEIELLTEAFYYLGARIRTIVKHKSQPLPGLQSFEAKGLRDVRNKLLEHPESPDSQVLAQSFGFGADCGPVIKGPRLMTQKDVFVDSGLYPNAAEFKESLESTLQLALDALPEKG